MNTEKQPKTNASVTTPSFSPQLSDQMATPETLDLSQHTFQSPRTLMQLQRLVGNQKTLSLLHRHPAPQRIASRTAPQQIQRETIMVDGEEVHINDYHLITCMDRVKKIGVSNTAHSVILEDIDLSGLGAVAAKNKGKSFEYGGYWWGWKGKKELFPEPKKGKTVELTGDQIQLLLQHIRDGEKPGKKDQDLLKAYLAWSVFGGQKSEANTNTTISTSMLREGEGSDDDEGTTELNFTVSTVDLPTGITMVKGKGNSGFLMGPNGSKEEYPHIHFFYAGTEKVESKKPVLKKDKKKAPVKSKKKELKPLPPIITITSALATLEPTTETKLKAQEKDGDPRRHWKVASNFTVIPVRSEGNGSKDKLTIPELMGALRTVCNPSKGSSSEKKEKKTSSASSVKMKVSYQAVADYINETNEVKATAEIIATAISMALEDQAFSTDDLAGMSAKDLNSWLFDGGYIVDLLPEDNEDKVLEIQGVEKKDKEIGEDSDDF